VVSGAGAQERLFGVQQGEARSSIMANRIRGVVKWFSAEKGYGFITPEQGADVFVHFSAIQMNGYRKLEAGDKVEFEITEGPKGKQAAMVQPINS
jgi:CspA family cold shock protein